MLLVFSSVSANAEEIPVGDIGVDLSDTPARVRELATCLWEKNRDAALRLSSQRMAQWKNAPPSPLEFRLRRTDTNECGGEPELSYILQNINALAKNLYLIRVNQAARCVISNKAVSISALFDKLLLDNKNLFAGVANVGNKTKLFSVFFMGVRLPVDLVAAATACDAEVGAWVDLDGGSRMLFANELDHEAKRNA